MTRPMSAKAPDVIAGMLRRRILSGDLMPGDSLPPEAELVSQLGVSRETARVALRLLEAEGLTETRQGRTGVRICHPEPEQVARSLVQLLTLTGATWGDLLAFRKMLEPPATGHVAEFASDEERAEILAAAQRGIAPDGTGYHEFHELVVRASGNAILTTVLAAIEQAVRWAAAEQRISQFDRDEAARSHREIAKAIVAGDRKLAERRMSQHLDAAQGHVGTSGISGEPMIPPARWSGEDASVPWR
ncbi:GntR family transcriptional regulator [Mycobacterium sp. NPDC050853]|uniref:FadR/GntR family transcriptional regulator n=1 Tax=Mycobacterium sp. NPDC050853 TaxID=3155160 RepID=UPI0033C9EE7E